MALNSSDIAYDVFPIPIPAADDCIRNFKHLRLTSLRLDPEAFSSTYERELQFTDEIWKDRVNGVQKVSIIAKVKGFYSNHSDENLGPRGGEPWVGSATTVSPRMLRDFGFPFPKSLEGYSVYSLNGVWVHPDHRGRGLAKRLHQVTVDWVKAHEDEPEAGQKKVMLALVKASNVPASSFYRGLGYKEIEGEIHPGCLTLILHIL